MPWGYHAPVACGGVLVPPGDIVIADGDGVVVVLGQLAETTARAVEHEDWEVFSWVRLAEGGMLRKYYPLSKEAAEEFEVWKRWAGAKGDGEGGDDTKVARAC